MSSYINSSTNNCDTPFATAVSVVPLKPDKASASQNATFKLPENRSSGQVDEKQVQRLMQQGFTRGLAQSLSMNNQSFPYRIWVVDNSGSMQKDDGHRIIETKSKNNVKIVPSSRWDEIRECVNYHVRMAGLLEAPTSFRLLNHPGATVGEQQFDVANAPGTAAESMQNAMSIMNKARPGGCTPLTKHILDIHSSIRQMAPDLRQSGKRVVIVLATDGLPTDELGYGGIEQQQQFVESLRMLEGFPVWIVIRLCTDEDDVVDFYNDLDEQLELSLEVLDDFCAEALEVYEHNKWLNYALPLHRCRELGYYDRVFDMIDERSLTKSELRDFCALLFGKDHFDGVPDPSIDWKGFMKEVSILLEKEEKQWNPVKKRVMPWIDLKKLNKKYGTGTCSIM
eukprot:CAMPEP_0195291352 /NCGR_PEP_ID=MMETSP0707-20130614/7745_1 /TAXON_ID=33640 /ORGANISM="Asterionellopsis glacialis, Strain CCMP134" /LENGTH=395 /DNA_ID=CAMNT_0040351657 /DNA_START=52 /DNA_END=1239 /DNA_ORIENTATION=+